MRPFDRRSFLKALGGLSLPAWFPRLAFSTAPGRLAAQRDVLVCVFQRGAADGLNSIVPVGDSHYFVNRPTIAIPEPTGAGGPGGSGAAIDLDGFFALHPALAPLKPLYDAGQLAAVHAAGSPDPTHSHFQAMDYMERGTPGSQAISTGWINRHLQALAAAGDADASPFRAVGFGTLLQASLRGPVPASALQSIADFHLKGRGAVEVQTFQASLASLYADGSWLDGQGGETLSAINALAAANPLAYLPQNGAQYPDSPFGLALRQVVQLIRAGVGLEVACVDVGGWDTHHSEGGSDGQLAKLLGDLAAGLAALATDLGDQMKRVLVVTMSEFGRRVLENASGGTDHGHGNSMLVLGGGVNGGKVYGSWPGLAPDQLASPGDLQVTTDFRTVLAEIVQRRLLNADLGQVFPGFQAPPVLGIVQPAS
jgi:uncharacterized protein (DUF1501 family)